MAGIDSEAVRRARLRRRRQQAATPWLPLFGALALLAGCLVFAVLLAALALANTPALAASEPLTLLVLGADLRAGEAGPTRSDAIILAGLRNDEQASLLSIPRDLWVDVPGVGEERINTAMFWGYDAGDPTAGARLAVETVERALGVPVDRFAVIDFQLFVRLVDGLGGIEVDVPVEIVDTQYPTPDYGVTTIRFDPGRQTLDGERALTYARTRHGDDDFGRSERQQQVIRAIAARLLEPSIWPRLPSLYQELRAGMVSNLQSDDWLALWALARAIGQGRVEAATLSDAATPWVTPNGAWVLLPDRAAIDQVLQRLFAATP
jgi:LCP family protein required for cell wall assembly